MNPRNQMIKSLLLKHKMHMARPIRVPMHLPQQPPNRPIMRNRIRHRRDGLEPKHSLPVTPHDTPSIRSLTVRMLHIIPSRRVRLPDINLGVLHGVPCRVADRADHEQRLAFCIARHVLARFQFLGFVCVEGAEDCALRASRRFWVVD